MTAEYQELKAQLKKLFPECELKEDPGDITMFLDIYKKDEMCVVVQYGPSVWGQDAFGISDLKNDIGYTSQPERIIHSVALAIEHIRPMLA